MDTGFVAHFKEGRCVAVMHKSNATPEGCIAVPISFESRDELSGVPYYRWGHIDGKLVKKEIEIHVVAPIESIEEQKPNRVLYLVIGSVALLVTLTAAYFFRWL